MNRKDLKTQSIFQLIFSVAIVLLLGYISSFVYTGIDLTQEKRYTLSPVSREVLEKLPGTVFIKVYLDGDMPIGFKRLASSVKEMIDEFRVYAGRNIEYEFIDPAENKDFKARGTIFKDLYKKGLQPTNVEVKDEKGGSTRKMLVPGALISYNGIDLPLNLLNNNPGISAEENLNNSIQSLEYSFINMLRNICNTKIEKIAFLEGHGELDQYQLNDIIKELSNYYQVDIGAINANIHSLDHYKVVLIAKPEQRFSEEDKFVLDQYIMNGGKVIWLIDEVKASLDSLSNGETVAFIQNLNLDDQLFKYGVRINPDLVQDIECALIPVNMSASGTTPKFSPAPWYYYPLINPSGLNPITRNVNLVKMEFPSVIDTVGDLPAIRKTILMSTSVMSKVVKVPVMISLNDVKKKISKEEFNKPFQTVAILLEGKFESLFKNRNPNSFKLKGDVHFLQISKETKMIVVSDGDVIRNNVRNTAQGIMISPLGLDRYSNQTFGNKEFILNAVNYLTDESGIMNLRNREIRLRLLDKNKIQNEKLKWQLINTLLPMIFIALFGLSINLVRKRRYSRVV